MAGESKRVTIAGAELVRLKKALGLSPRMPLSGELIAERAEALADSVRQAADRELQEMTAPAWSPRR